MKRLKQLIIASTIALSGIFVAAPLAPTASAIDVFQNGCQGGGTSTGGQKICGATKTDDFQNIMKNIINTMFIVLGMIAVVMIVIGGIRYVTSGGDSSQIQAAKNTVLYAVVGLIVAILAYAIVNFTLNAFS